MENQPTIRALIAGNNGRFDTLDSHVTDLKTAFESLEARLLGDGTELGELAQIKRTLSEMQLTLMNLSNSLG